VPLAIVTETTSGRSATADAAGNFLLDRLAAGLLTLQVSAPTRAAYKPTTVGVQTAIGQVTRLDVGLVPSGIADPAQVTIAPRNLTVQTNVSRQFEATIKDAGGNVLPIHPTWNAANNIGQIDRMGLLSAVNTSAQPISGQVIATAGLATDAVPVTVSPAGPPVVTNFVVSPLTLGHGGGSVSISAQVEDGDGVDEVVATVSCRRLATSTDVVLPLVTGDAKFGHYQSTHVVSPNTAPSEPTGGQPTELYDVYATATDALSVTSPPTSPLVLTVNGVSAPPPPAF
jgi:hypothetical protein